jgi:hypothetical protein
MNFLFTFTGGLYGARGRRRRFVNDFQERLGMPSLLLGMTKEGQVFVPTNPARNYGFIAEDEKLTSAASVKPSEVSEIHFKKTGEITSIDATRYSDIGSTTIPATRVEFAGTRFEIGGRITGNVFDGTARKAGEPVIREALRPHAEIVAALLRAKS